LEAFPDVIVNCAAISEPAACDADPARSDAMNVALPARLAELAHHLGGRVLHVSSEQVFDGSRTAPYSEQDAVSPINLYGRQKVASERAVLAAAPQRAAVVRAPLLMGDSPGGRRALHERLLSDWAAARTPRLYTDEFRQPCTAANLAEVLRELAERPDTNGVFHWAGVELMSRFELGCRIRRHFKLSDDAAPITPITRAETPDVASSRQACLALDVATLSGRLVTQPQSLDEQLAGLRIPFSCRAWYQQQR
ncbi:MAG TPA: sugar nucleotide-binding protein, partial [Opitutus sp.]|nr:sugar nucleotide-binding protein [Opitutus sp.]